MELLLRHAIQYFDMPALLSGQDMDATGFDDRARFEAGLGQLPPHEQKLVSCVHLLALLLDGTLSIDEIPQFEVRLLAAAATHHYHALFVMIIIIIIYIHTGTGTCNYFVVGLQL